MPPALCRGPAEVGLQWSPESGSKGSEARQAQAGALVARNLSRGRCEAGPSLLASWSL